MYMYILKQPFYKHHLTYYRLRCTKYCNILYARVKEKHHLLNGAFNIESRSVLNNITKRDLIKPTRHGSTVILSTYAN